MQLYAYAYIYIYIINYRGLPMYPEHSWTSVTCFSWNGRLCRTSLSVQGLNPLARAEEDEKPTKKQRTWGGEACPSWTRQVARSCSLDSWAFKPTALACGNSRVEECEDNFICKWLDHFGQASSTSSVVLEMKIDSDRKWMISSQTELWYFRSYFQLPSGYLT